MLHATQFYKLPEVSVKVGTPRICAEMSSRPCWPLAEGSNLSVVLHEGYEALVGPNERWTDDGESNDSRG